MWSEKWMTVAMEEKWRRKKKNVGTKGKGEIKRFIYTCSSINVFFFCCFILFRMLVTRHARNS